MDHANLAPRCYSPFPRQAVRRVAWEDLARLPAMYRDEAAPLKHYMRTKTLRLQPAFNI